MQYSSPAPMTIDQVASSAWADPAVRGAVAGFWLESLRSSRTRAAYRRDITAWFAWCDLAGVPVSDACRADVKAWRDSLIAAGRSPVTVGLKLSAVSGFYDFWWQRNVATGNPAAPAGAAPGMGRRRSVIPVAPADGRLEVLREVEPVASRATAKRSRAVLCRCACGTVVTVKVSNLPRTRSCGCWRREVSAALGKRRHEKATEAAPGGLPEDRALAGRGDTGPVRR